jgi:hypothetical protein
MRRRGPRGAGKKTGFNINIDANEQLGLAASASLPQCKTTIVIAEQEFTVL